MKHLYHIYHGDTPVEGCVFSTEEGAEAFIESQKSALFPLDFPVSELRVVEQKEDECDWKSYVPETCYLYYVDYHDNFNGHGKLLQECLEKNELFPIYEMLNDWWDFPEQHELDEIRESMENDGMDEEYEEHYEEIRELLWERDKSTPVDDLFGNTGDIALYYTCDLDLDHGWHTAFLAEPWQNESNAMAAYKIRRCLGIKKGTPAAELIDKICNESPYGGDLRIYFRGDIRDFINGEVSECDFKTIRFSGEVAVAVHNPTEGCGWYEMMELECELPFVRENLRISVLDHYSIEHVFGVDSDFCSSNSQHVSVSTEPSKRKVKLKASQKISMEKHFEEVFRKGGCSCGDACMDRHRDIVYRNEIPCRWECPHCGREWLD